MTFPALGIRRKLALMTLLSLFPLLLLGVALSVYLSVDITRQENLRQEVTAFESINNVLTFETQMGDSDICFLAALPAVPEIFRAREHAGHDPAGGLTLDKALPRLAGTLSRFLVIKKVYDQVRLIDKSGQEVLRVNLTGDQAEVAPPAQLQNKGDRYYFKEAAKLPPRGDYVSPIDLNQEQGKVEKPFKPMLRLAAPIHDEAGVFQGIVILNKYADRFLSHIMVVPEKIGGVWFIADEQGNYVYHTQDPHRLWGGPEGLNTGEGLCKDFPNACRAILSGKSTSILWQGKTWQVHSQRYNLWPSHSRFITVVRMTPQPGFADYFRRDTWLLAGLALLTALLAGLLIWRNARSISQPILDLNQAVVQFSQGHWEARAPVATKDEIGNVCINFNVMADKLTRLTQNLEEEVKGQTEELREYKDQLKVKVAERTVELEVANEQLEQEIVERRRGEQALRESEELYRSLFENMLNGFAYCKMLFDHNQPQDFIFLKVNNSFEPLTGLKDVVGKKVSEVVPGIRESDPGLFEIFGRVALTGKPEKTEIYLESLKMWGSISVYSPAKEYFVVVFDVITDRKRAEEELRLTQFAVERFPDLISWIGPDGRFLYVNESSSRNLGYSRAEHLQLTVPDVCPDMPQEKWPEHFQELKRKGNLTLETDLRRKDGTLFPAEVSANYLEFQGREYNVAMVRDITARKGSEEALRASAHRWQTTFDAIGDGVCLMDQENMILECNQAMSNVLGKPLDEIIGRHCWDIVHGTFGPIAGCPALKGKRTLHRETLVLPANNRWFNVMVDPIVDEAGNYLGAVHIMSDITDQKRAHDTLQKWAHIFEHAEWGVVVGSADGTTLEMMNPAFAKMHGYTVPELTGRPILEVFAPESRAEVPAHINRAHQQGHHAFESRHIRKDGSIFPVLVDVTAVKNERGEVLYRAVNVQDITASKQAEGELHRINRALQALSAVNLALIHAQEETALLAEVCRVIVEVGGYVMAWVGYAEHDAEKTVRPVARAGHDDGYIDSIKVTWDEGPTGQGGAGRAIRTGKPWVIHDTLNDPNFRPWAQEAQKRGYGAAICLPLVADTGTFGSLAIYGGKDSFDAQEFELLQQLGRNLSYGIETLRVRVQHQQAQAEMQKLSTAVAQATDWVVITDKEGNVEYANEAAAAMSGYTREELIGHNPRIFKSGQHDTQFYQDLWTTIAAGHPYRNIFINRKKDGELFHLDMAITPLRDREGNVIKYLSTAKDITQQLKLQERLNYLAYNDPLTGLPNRTLFMDRVRQTLASSKHSGKSMGLIALDLDRFKFINETFGPETGDEALREVGHKLAGLVRDGDTVARLGSDEFGILLADLSETDDIVLVLEKIRKGITHPIQVSGQDLMLSFSIGITMFPQDGADAPTLMQNADSAMAKAKELGGNNYQFYAAGMNVKAANFVLLGNQLLHALHQHEFILHYQPYYQASTGRMVGMEALIRWQHPERGLVPPGDFIPILEDTGLIREVGEWTMREACRQVKEWQQQGYEMGPVSVNFSGVQFSWPGLVALVERVLNECGLDPHFLTAEITESAIMHNVEYTESVLSRFKQLGMSISIDDFGTGYSSLSYLKRFPINNLKIDISFIREVTTDADTAAIVQAIISMAHSLDLKTIAEGVETKEQVQILRLLRCDIIQGFYYSHPLPPQEFVKLFGESSPSS